MKHLTVALGFLTIGIARESVAQQTYDVFAVRFGTVHDFPKRALVAGADRDARVDIAMMVWVIRGDNGKTILVDTGFHRANYVERWNVDRFVEPSDAVRQLGVAPEDITDIIISHLHWDHAGGIDLFPKGRIWIQRDELTHYRSVASDSVTAGVDPIDLAAIAEREREGLLELVDGDREILPGISVHTGGRHTYASQFVSVRSAAGTVVIASDNAYLYENLERRVPIAQTLDAESNLRAQDRMKALAGDPRLIVPGHDPDVFRRFTYPGGDIAQIR